MPDPILRSPQKHPFVVVNPIDDSINVNDANPDGQTPARDSVAAKGDPTKITDAFGGKRKGKKKKPETGAEQMEEAAPRLLKTPTVKIRKAASSGTKKGLAPRKGSGGSSVGSGLWRMVNRGYAAKKRRERVKAQYADKAESLKQRYAEKPTDKPRHDDDDESYIQKRLRQHRLNHEAKRRFEAERQAHHAGENPSPSPQHGHKWEGSKQVKIGHHNQDAVRRNSEHQKEAGKWSEKMNHPDKDLAAHAKRLRDYHLGQIKSVKEGALDEWGPSGVWGLINTAQTHSNAESLRKLKNHLETKHRELQRKLKSDSKSRRNRMSEGVRVARSPSLRETTTLMRKAQQYGIHYSIIKEVYQRGLLEWNHTDKMTPQQKAFGRVNSFIQGGKAREWDYDLALESGNPNLLKKGTENL